MYELDKEIITQKKYTLFLEKHKYDNNIKNIKEKLKSIDDNSKDIEFEKSMLELLLKIEDDNLVLLAS